MPVPATSSNHITLTVNARDDWLQSPQTEFVVPFGFDALDLSAVEGNDARSDGKAFTPEELAFIRLCTMDAERMIRMPLSAEIRTQLW